MAVNVLANTYIDTSEDNWTYGRMHQWRVHTAFANITRVVAMKESVYALSNNSLISVDKLSQEISYHNRLTGLNGSSIDQMEYNATTDALLVSYQNGQLDIIDAEGDIHNVPDLYLKQMSYAKVVNHIYMHEQKAYLSMTFGIIVLDMQKREIQDTYFLGGEGMAVDVKSTTILGDSIYALSSNSLYVASMQSNLMDYASWQASPLPKGTDAKDLCVYDELCNQLPEHEYERISRLIWEEQEEHRMEAEAARRFAVFHVTEQGKSTYFVAEENIDTLQVANRLRVYTRKPAPKVKRTARSAEAKPSELKDQTQATVETEVN